MTRSAIAHSNSTICYADCSTYFTSYANLFYYYINEVDTRELTRLALHLFLPSCCAGSSQSQVITTHRCFHAGKHDHKNRRSTRRFHIFKPTTKLFCLCSSYNNSSPLFPLPGMSWTSLIGLIIYPVGQQ